LLIQGDHAFFTAWGDAGLTLWRIDGPDATPIVVEESAPYSLFDAGGALLGIDDNRWLWRYLYGGLQYLDRPAELAVFGRRTVFMEDATWGTLLGTSGGTQDSTIRLQRLEPAEDGAYATYDCEPPRFTRAGDLVFFAAQVGDVGCELWALPLAALNEVCVEDCPPPPTATRTPGPVTPSPTPSCIGAACTQVIAGEVSGTRGETVTIDISLLAQGKPVAGVQNDLGFSPSVAVAANGAGRPDCHVNPAIDKPATAFAFQPPGCRPGRDCNAVRALVLSLDHVDPIADGAQLYSCAVEIAPRAALGRHALPVFTVGAATSRGEELEAGAVEGGVTVLASGVSGSRTAGGGGCAVGPQGDVGWAAVGLVLALAAAARRGRASGFVGCGRNRSR
jgi:hypothetical protein